MRHHFVRSSAGLRDPNFKNVTLLLHGDGTNGAQNNTFLDSSASNNAITRTGNVVQGSFSPYGDRWSNYFDGTGDYLTIPAGSAFAYGTGNFTVEGWFFMTGGTQGNYPALIWAQTSGSVDYFFIGVTTTNTIVFNFAATGFGTPVYGPSNSVVQNTWIHFAVVRSGTTATVYVNGIGGTPVTCSQDFTNTTFVPTMGRYTQADAGRFTGYISNFRILKGTAAYTSNFSVPTSPLSAIANTSILTCQSNRFRDASSNNFTITRNGDVSVQRFSPFSPDAQYRTDRIGGSAYFDGSSDWLFVANRALKLTAGFFTAECWVYLDNFPGDNFSGYTIFSDYYWTGGNTGGYFVNIGSNQKVNLYASSGVYAQQAVAILSSNNSIVLKQWNHIAIVRGEGNLINIYINGVSTTTPVARTSLSLLSGGAANLESRIGVRLHDVWYGPPGDAYGPFIGTISDLRVINGKCLYTANFTPPVEPLTAIPETTFLGRFTNGSIVDNAMMCNIETVDNAQINTTTKRYGTGSFYFDGTGDYLRVHAGLNADLSSGDFTIECWFYALSAAVVSSIIQQGEHDWRLSFGTDRSMRLALAGVERIQTAASAFNLNTWNHLAAVKSGTTITMYINGISVGTTTNSPLSSSRPVYVGINVAPVSGVPTLFWPLNGYVDEARITKGIARYTSNFTPPTAPFPDF